MRGASPSARDDGAQGSWRGVKNWGNHPVPYRAGARLGACSSISPTKAPRSAASDGDDRERPLPVLASHRDLARHPGLRSDGSGTIASATTDAGGTRAAASAAPGPSPGEVTRAYRQPGRQSVSGRLGAGLCRPRRLSCLAVLNVTLIGSTEMFVNRKLLLCLSTLLLPGVASAGQPLSDAQMDYVTGGGISVISCQCIAPVSPAPSGPVISATVISLPGLTINIPVAGGATGAAGLPTAIAISPSIPGLGIL